MKNTSFYLLFSLKARQDRTPAFPQGRRSIVLFVRLFLKDANFRHKIIFKKFYILSSNVIQVKQDRKTIGVPAERQASLVCFTFKKISDKNILF